MMKRTLSALLVSGALLCTAALPALAAEPAEETQTNSAQIQEETMPDSVLYYGEITEIGREEDGTITRLSLTSEADGAYVMNISAATVWIDSGNRTASDPSDLEVGERVYVYHSPVSTRSLPPQSAAYAVVRNFPQDVGAAQYQEAEAIDQREDGSLVITTDNGGLLISVDENTVVNTYAGEEASLEDLQVGDWFMSWHQIVLTSYPGQTYTDHLMILPAEEASTEEEPSDPAETSAPAELPQEGAELTILLEGDMALPVTGRYENGVAMVPVAATAQALGYQVTYTPAERAEDALVTVESDQFRVEMHFNVPTIFGVTKVEGAVGMTAPQDYGAAPYAVDPGVTWAPAQLFELLGRTVTLEGNTLSIQ